MQNFMKTIINAVQSWTKKEIRNSTADWNQNNENAIDYVKNRTHYMDKTIIFPETIFNSKLTEFIPLKNKILKNETYIVNFNNIVYKCKMFKSNNQWMLGNEKVFYKIWDIPFEYKDTGEPFAIAIDSFMSACSIMSEVENNKISIIGPSIVKRIDADYLPNSIFTNKDGFNLGENTVASGEYSYAIGNQAIASGYCSHAEGYNTTASGHVSHAEGNNTIASSMYSHAEGYSTTASGKYSHAEGNNTTASGDYSHAEGNNTTASGDYSHAEGTYNNPEKPNSVYGFAVRGQNMTPNVDIVTISKNFTFDELTGKFILNSPTLQVSKDDLLLYINYAMIDGKNCETSDEIWIITGKSQNSKYLYNSLYYTASESSSKRGYIHSIGNGIFNYPSNAHTIDYFGVGWFQGGLQVGGNAQDDGAKNVMLEGNAYDYFILTDASTGTPYKIQIIDGNLVSSAMTSETESTT